MELLRLSKAVQRPGVHPMTLRQWAIDGRIPFCRVGCERWFSWVDVENMKRGNDSATPVPGGRCCPGECPGRTGTSPLAAREEEPRATSSGTVVTVVKDRGSGLQKPGGRDELLEDFGSLATTFAGRWYGMRPARARERLLAETGRRSEDGAV